MKPSIIGNAYLSKFAQTPAAGSWRGNQEIQAIHQAQRQARQAAAQKPRQMPQQPASNPAISKPNSIGLFGNDLSRYYGLR